MQQIHAKQAVVVSSKYQPSIIQQEAEIADAIQKAVQMLPMSLCHLIAKYTPVEFDWNEIEVSDRMSLQSCWHDYHRDRDQIYLALQRAEFNRRRCR